MANISKIRVGGVDYDIKDQELATEVGKKADSSSLAKVATSGSYNDLSNKPTIPTAVTESTVSGWGFTKNTGTYSKPSTGIPKTDLASAVQTSLGKADTALQSYTEQYKGTVTKVKINGSEKSPDSNGLVDLGTIESSGEGGGSSGGEEYVELDSSQSQHYLSGNRHYHLNANSGQSYRFSAAINVGEKFRLSIGAESFGSITFMNQIVWANNNNVEFQNHKTIEMSFEMYQGMDQVLAGVWAVFDFVRYSGGGSGGA